MEIVNKATSCPFTAFDTHKWQLYPFSLTLCPPLIYFQIACHRFLENIYFGVEVPAVVGNIHFSQPRPALHFPDGPRVPRAWAAGGGKDPGGVETEDQEGALCRAWRAVRPTPR